MRFIQFFSFFLLTSFSFAKTSSSSLSLQDDLFKAQNKGLRATQELRSTQLQLDRAKFVLEMETNLFNHGAGSYFGYSQALVEWVRKLYEVERANNWKKEAEIEEKVYRMRLDWEQGVKEENVLELGQLYVNLRKEQLLLMRSLAESTKVPVVELKTQWEKIAELTHNGSASKNELSIAKLNYDEAIAIQKTAGEGVILAEKQLAEAIAAVEGGKK